MLDEEGVSLPTPLKWFAEEEQETWPQWVQLVHVTMRQVYHVHGGRKKLAQVCGFSRPVGETQSELILQELVAKLKQRQQKKLQVRAKAEGTDWEAEDKQAKKRVETAWREVEDQHGRIYRNMVAEDERYTEKKVPYKSLRYIQELAEAGRPQERKTVRLQDCRVTGNIQEVLAAVDERFLVEAQQGTAGAQQDHTKDSAGTASGIHEGTKRGHTLLQGDARGNGGGSTGA